MADRAPVRASRSAPAASRRLGSGDKVRNFSLYDVLRHELPSIRLGHAFTYGDKIGLTPRVWSTLLIFKTRHELKRFRRDLLDGFVAAERLRFQTAGGRLVDRDLQNLFGYHPTLPSRLTATSFCASTANSMGSSCRTSRTKPLTSSATLSSVERPRLWQ